MIVGVFQPQQDVVGVFNISTSIDPEVQRIRLVRGDSIDLSMIVYNGVEPPDPVELLGGIVRFCVRFGIKPVTALITKTSHSPNEIQLDTFGRALIHITPADTRDLPLSGGLLWDIEATLPGEAIDTSAILANITSGSNVLYAAAGSWSDFRPGDLITLQGHHTTVTNALNANQIEVDRSDWENAVHTVVSAHRAHTRTVASGPFIVRGDVA